MVWLLLPLGQLCHTAGDVETVIVDRQLELALGIDATFALHPFRFALAEVHETNPCEGIPFTDLFAAESREHKIRLVFLVFLLLNLVADGSTDLDFTFDGIFCCSIEGVDTSG